MKCKQYSGITVESGTHVKSVEITLNIFAVYSCDHIRFLTKIVERCKCNVILNCKVVELQSPLGPLISKNCPSKNFNIKKIGTLP